MNLALTIIIAILLDHYLGEPKKNHPLVYFGYLVTLCEAKMLCLNHSALKQKFHGLLAVLFMLMPLTLLTYSMVQSPIVNAVFAPLILYFCIAANSLNHHATCVFTALEENQLSIAKQRVAMIVSRQTDNMTVLDIRKATIESVLENGADAIFAPLFWFIILGPAGALLYRLNNTLDAMWGYKNQRYLWFGWAAARFDDVLNWIPARLTALSYALLGKTALAVRCWKTQAHLLDSPNAGPVMTSGAGALDLQLGGPAWYEGVLKNKIVFGTQNKPQNKDIHKANSLINYTLLSWVLIILLLQFVGVSFA